ncbi:MAG: ATP-binding protein [Spirochaetaceae bacterium]|nr:ATP-binding protein [Spirochaetaceae bacterium]
MKFKNQLILVMLITVIFVLFSSVTLARSTFSSTLLETEKSLLASESHYIKSTLLNTSDAKLDDYASAHDIRITIIDDKGVPVFDSMSNVADMENHFYRDEIIGARTNSDSFSTRRSETTKYNTLYSATYFPDVKLYVRTSTNIESLNIWDSRFIRQLIPFSLVLAIFISIIVIILIELINKPVKELAEAAHQYRHGEFKVKTAIEGPYEFARLSSVMNQMATDIEDQINKLTDDRNTYSSILSSMVEGVLVTDQNKRITLCNRSAINYFGLDVTEPVTLIGLFSDIKFDTVVSNAMRDDVAASYIFSRFENLSGDSAKIVGAGEDRTYQVIIAPITDKGNCTGSVLTFNDVSELKHLENVRKDFVSNVSHELKTPLTSITGFADILVHETLDDVKTKKYAKIIEKNSLQMKDVIDDLLTLASLEKDNIQIEMKVESVNPIIEEALESVEYKKKDKNITIEYEVQSDLNIYCSKPLLRVAIINLLTNAISYSDNNKTIIINTKETDKNYLISVKDNGVGIPKKDQDRIFERFYRVDKARSKSSGGTGLGLSIVNHIMSLHSGSVSCESKDGVGSTFTLSIPKERLDISILKDKSKALYPQF